MIILQLKKRTTVHELKKIANDLRKKVVTMIYEAKSGHPGGSLSAADYIAAVYFREIRVDPQNPKWEDRDRFVLSKGHVCPVLYAALAKRGFFDEELIHTLRQEGSFLQGHPSMVCPGIDIPTGSLGQGLACAVGMAIAGKRDGKNYRVFAVLGDGECQEGEIWEAAQTANKYELDNLVVFVDNNNLQIDGTTDEVMPTLDLGDKFRAFGFEVYKIDGHNMDQIVRTLDTVRLRRKSHRPKCIVGQTIKGRGVEFMENIGGWHGIAPKQDEFEEAIQELDSIDEILALEADEQ